MACELSRAGMMPSSRESVWKAASASSSVTDGVLHPAGVLEEGVLRTHRGIVQAGGDGVGLLDLAVLVLEDVGVGAVEDARGASRQRGAVLAGVEAQTARLDAHHAHARVVHELVEHADGVAAGAHAGDERVGQPALLGQDLPARLPADDRLEVADHGRVRSRARPPSR